MTATTSPSLPRVARAGGKQRLQEPAIAQSTPSVAREPQQRSKGIAPALPGALRKSEKLKQTRDAHRAYELTLLPRLPPLLGQHKASPAFPTFPNIELAASDLPNIEGEFNVKCTVTALPMLDPNERTFLQSDADTDVLSIIKESKQIRTDKCQHYPPTPPGGTLLGTTIRVIAEECDGYSLAFPACFTVFEYISRRVSVRLQVAEIRCTLLAGRLEAYHLISAHT